MLRSNGQAKGFANADTTAYFPVAHINAYILPIFMLLKSLPHRSVGCNAIN